MFECPFCKSVNTEILSSTNITRKSQHITHASSATNTMTATYDYPLHTFLCLDCGNIFEQMPRSALDNYNTEKQYFIKA